MPRRRPGVRAFWLGAWLAAALAALPARGEPPAAAEPDSCAALALLAVPAAPDARQRHLDRLDTARERCIHDAGFLAALGGAWLEHGDAAQALLWLERALLLAPDLLAARADHALALAALGEPQALRELAREWGQRTDIPPALLERLATQLAVAQQRPPRWALRREFTLLLGAETNLNQSPALTELTLTPPEGPIDLPLAEPLEPVAGGALIAEGSLQLEYRPRPGRAWLAGATVTTRLAPAARDTNWLFAQVAASWLETRNAWRLQVSVAEVWSDGRLDDDYRADRASVGIDRAWGSCRHRLVTDVERRHQRTPILDGRLTGVVYSARCALGSDGLWVASLAGRWAVDDAVDPNRPGGTQDRYSLGLRLQARLPERRGLDLGARYTFYADREGYSPLLENNARRQQRLLSLSVEFTQPLDRLGPGWQQAEWVVLTQLARQRSNLELFAYRTATLYSGLRVAW